MFVPIHSCRPADALATVSGFGVCQLSGSLCVQYLIVINIASANLKIIKSKYPVACSRSVGAAGERDLLIME